ncbi:GatB/YqeY domain-containing protein [Pelovirga terrestris]|uniref:GatB/YqeY domain-containing protein n=1 Tax=Pelovirga terrestris TaxID=2771352 RepID=A0A8J6UGY7_9BACT|nr:GatB/YqeY domain-containing protein [Pelovirga terrestris]MBD1400633.1 GatB/YqeY domain-containing protein [Pelovirga terrestris]
MSLKEQLNQDMKAAMKSRQTDRLSTIRQLRSAIKNKEIELRQDIDDNTILAVISTLVKQRRESAELYRSNDRPELADKEEAELAVLQQYLPAQLSEDELRALVAEVITATGAASIKDIGKVMPVVMAKTKGSAEGRLVNQVVRELLAGPAD